MPYFKAVRPDGTDFRTGTIDYSTGGVVRHRSFPVTADPAEAIVPRGGTHEFVDADSYLSVSTEPTDCTGMAWPARVFEVEPVGPVWTPHASSLPNKRACLAVREVAELNPIVLLGPQGAQVEAIIERSKTLTYAEARGMAAAWDAAEAAARAAARAAAEAAARDAAWAAAGAAAEAAARAAAEAAARAAAWDAAEAAARAAARAAAEAAARDAAWAAAWDAAEDAAWAAAWAAAGAAARDAAWDAAGAAAEAAARAAAGVLTRDLIGTGSYTQEHYDFLTGPWRRVIGKVHPDDSDLREEGSA